jgi:hypothetical protein
MHKSATKCKETIGKWCKNKHGASKIIDTFETYQDPTRISSDELKEVEIDDGVRAVTNLKKKSTVPKIFGAVAFSKSHPQTEVHFSCLSRECL